MRPSFVQRVAFVVSLVVSAPHIGAGTRDSSTYARLEEEFLSRPAGAVKQDVLAGFVAAAVASSEAGRGLEVLARHVFAAGGMSRSRPLGASRIRRLIPAARAYSVLRSCSRQGVRAFTAEAAVWALGTEERLAQFAAAVSPSDDWRQCLRIVEVLHDHDPAERDAFRPLILAIATVWDQPRPPMHGQMGGGQLPFEVSSIERYDFFKGLYSSGRAKVRLRELLPEDLVYVVDTPIPVSELRWTVENVRGSARTWSRKFTDIDYVEPRMARRQFQWPHGAYTLAAIRERGGICVDQAYYATITARVFGVPALLFVGEGRRGPHAWFGYRKSRREWELDTGRYARDRYATGHAIHPTSNRPMTDHDLWFLVLRSREPKRCREADDLVRLATVLLERGNGRAAEGAAEGALARVLEHPVAWAVLEATSRVKGADEALSLFKREAEALDRYPDLLAGVRRRQGALLRELGRDREADELIQRAGKRLERHRDDLTRELVTDQIRVAYESGNYGEARGRFEALLRRQRFEGAKLVPLLESYVGITADTGQAREGLIFLNRFLPRQIRRLKRGDRFRETFVELLVLAHRNAGETEDAETVKARFGVP